MDVKQKAARARELLHNESFVKIMDDIKKEQVNRFLSATTTFGRVAAYSLTLGTSTTPPILRPQWQTKTPMRGTFPQTSFCMG